MRNLRSKRKHKCVTADASSDSIVFESVPEETDASNFYSAGEDETCLGMNPTSLDISTAGLLADLSSAPVASRGQAPNISLNSKPPKKCLFIGLVWLVEETVSEQELCTMADKTSHQNMCPLRDAARILKARQFGFDVYSLDRKDSASPKHFCMSLEAYERSPNFELLKNHLFSEISIDFVWMPVTYLSDTVLRSNFYSSMLPFFATILEDYGRIYVPATIDSFSQIVQNWPVLSKTYLLRYLRDDQLEESTLFRATKCLPLERFGKEPVEKQIARYGLSYREVVSVPGVPRELKDHHPGALSVARFLCLTRLRKVRHTSNSRFQNFSNEYLQSRNKRLKSKQTLRLAEESLLFLSKPALRIRSIQIHPSKSIATYNSPFHHTFLDGRYGSGQALSKKQMALALPRFDPHSVGALKIPPGSWSCLKCSAINDKRRPLHVCNSCSSTPMRVAKLSMKPLSTSKYLTQMSDNSDNFDTDGSTDDSADEGYCIADELRILKGREYSEYGKKFTSQDRKKRNEEMYRRFISNDNPPTGHDAKSMWSTVIAFPINNFTSGVLIGKKFELDNKKNLREILSKTIVCVQKGFVQLVMAFQLHKCPHAVMGNNALTTFSDLIGATPVKLDNTRDHVFNPKYPNRPIVCNTDEVTGIDDRDLIQAIGLPRHTIGLSLKEQVKLCLQSGLMDHGEEYVALSTFDSRGTMSFHAGVSPREGKQWRRKNGCGIALPGLRTNSLRASTRFRNWLLHLEVLIAHCFIERFLCGTEREHQGVPNQYHLEVLKEYIDYLGCPAKYATHLRIGGGLSLNCGTVSFHLDHLNDPRPYYDQIAWGSIFVESWQTILTPESLQSMKTSGVSTDNSMFTALVYGRAIVGSQADRLAGVVNESSPFFQCCVSLINNESFPTDHTTLENETTRTNLMRLLENHVEDGSKLNFDYSGKFARLQECNNRLTFLGSFAVPWFNFLDKYRGHVRVRHCFEYISFVMRECNGTPLFVATMNGICKQTNEMEIRGMLQAPCPAFYVMLSKEMRRHSKKDRGIISSQAPRWQIFDYPLWKSDVDDWNAKTYVKFVSDQLFTMGNSALEEERCAARRNLCSASERKLDGRWTKDELSTIVLGAVRGTFGIQLSAFLLSTPPENAHYASIEKGESGFYKCLNLHLRDKYNGKNLTTGEAIAEVNACMESLQKKGFPITLAWMDQNCCYWYRKNGRDDGKDGRKKDIFFFDESGQLYLPLRAKQVSKGPAEIQFFVRNDWYNLASYWKPAYEMANQSSIIKRQHDHPTQTQLVDLPVWVKKIGLNGSLKTFRDSECLLDEGGLSMF
jgi:hypothetical protein